ncbi:MAG TPA: hypothetical protein VF173_21960 [Thermoanaerobaculia bacterium]|nr:hypothetical protein [Thermoanaerobaculia bacterium]
MLLTMFLMGIVPLGAERSKNIDYTPDVLSDDYWKDHEVALVRVTAVGGGRIGYEIVSPIWGAPAAGELPLAHLWFGMHAEPPAVAPGQLWIFYLPKHAPAEVPAEPVASASSPLVKRLLAIARLQRQPDERELPQAAFDADPMVARYALGRLLRQPSAARGLDVARLRAVRDDETRDPHVRLLASDLAMELEGKPRASADEYAWLTSAITHAPAKDFNEVAPLIDRLLEFADRRAPTAALLSRLATNERMPKAVRIAAYGAFQDPRLLQPKERDAVTGEIFAACVELLKDQDAEMRRAGATLLQGILQRLTPAARGAYVERARQALAAASAVEKDRVTQEHFERNLSSLAGPDQDPQDRGGS